MKVLLTGANGFLGKIIKNTLEKEYQIIELSRKSGDYQVSLDKEILEFTESFDLVIHCAGKAHFVPKKNVEKKQFHEVNVIGTENLLKGLEKTVLPKQFVFISSVSVYGQEYGKDINEEHQQEAKDPYGLSKIEAEALVMKWCKKQNVVCTILRLPLLVGEDPPGNLGAMIKAIDKGYYFNIGGGKARKSMVLAQDVAKFIPKVAIIGGIYNLTDGHHPDFSELSMAISKQKNKKKPLNVTMFIANLMGYAGDLLGNKAPINTLKLKKITSDLTFDDTKAREVAGWNPQGVIEWYGKTLK
ncbi:NAD-dependent epimerase/dehydratase family protein [Flavobacterium granuli]|uniref:Nucleoside-diphosphate-sugar epimerase n=1 Tax=Flavobacterium granuli TaxID=280093 RepID=A0A1M5SIC8_9FLAO|nr:NAD-dependent epimerase/dehydratase family protein [Flavobacterium granuli]PRZ20999.1 nucleoside-diphosphate-sugar epimerase [Flavobacterium granuli]SHH38296.1 Nucleoside-diphosphate-sugar epimerase [Flavobacterium granuli]